MAYLYCIMGRLGGGKTTAASFFPHLWRIMVEQKGGHLELFANYQLAGAHLFKTYRDWLKVAEAHGSVVVWDEAHRTFDSRKFSDYEHIFATELLTFVRKFASVQVFATPSVNRLDTRIREIIEILIVARNTPKGTYYDFYDYQADFGGKYGQYLHSKFLPHFKRKKVHDLHLFDSYMIPQKVTHPKTEREGIRFMEELEIAHEFGVENARNRKGIINAIAY